MQFASGDSLPTAQRRNVDGYLPGFENYAGMQGQAAILGATTSVYSMASKLADTDPNKQLLLQLSLKNITSILSVDPEQGSPAEEENDASEQQELVVPATDVQLCSICQEELVFNQARNAFENVIFTACMHGFHTNCLATHRRIAAGALHGENNPKCPNCNELLQ